MKYYFQLQYRMLNRHLADVGIPIFVLYLLVSVIFTVLSYSFFQRLPAAGYIYVTIALSLIIKLSERSRNEFLKVCFTQKDYHKVRVVENTLAALPFVLFMCYKMAFLPCLILLILSTLLAFVPLQTQTNFVLPTPFYKKPFEFIVGFRQSFYLFAIPYYIAYFAYDGHNIGLSVFAIVLLFLICSAYYTNVENEFYVWVHQHNPKAFLFHKLTIAWMYASILALPMLLILGGSFISEIGIILGATALGYVYLSAFLLAKYANFPQQIDIVHSFLLILSIILPPLLLFTIPLFYQQSIKRLQTILA